MESREECLDRYGALCDLCLKFYVVGFNSSARARKTAALLIFKLGVVINCELISDQKAEQVV